MNKTQRSDGCDKSGVDQVDLGDRIEADTIIVEIIDKHTGMVFRRDLPIRYLENANGVLLSGEAIDGSPSQIAFLSDTAFAKIHDLFGKGPDAPRCDHT